MSDRIPPPQQVPAPFLPDDPAEPITGSHLIPASLKDVTNARREIDDRIADAKKSTETRAAVLFIIGALATLGTGFLSVRAIAQDAGSKPALEVQVEVIALKNRASALEQGQVQQRADTHEVQVDIRELYRVVRDGRKSDRLEAPAPAPAPTDGGR